MNSWSLRNHQVEGPQLLGKQKAFTASLRGLATLISVLLLASSQDGRSDSAEPQRIYPPSAIVEAGETQEQVAQSVNGNGEEVRCSPDVVEKFYPILVPQTKTTSCVLAVIHSCLRSKGIHVKQQELLESEIARWNIWEGTPMSAIPQYLEQALGHPLAIHKLPAMGPSVWNQKTASIFLDEVRRQLALHDFTFISIQVGPLKRHALRLLDVEDDGHLVVLNPRYGPHFDEHEDTVDKKLLIQRWPARWLRQPLMADVYFVGGKGLAELKTNVAQWENPPSRIAKALMAEEFLVRPGGVPHAYVAMAILRLESNSASIDEVMATKSAPSQDSGHNWFYYLGDVLGELARNKFVKNYLVAMNSTDYPDQKDYNQFIRDLRERHRKNSYTVISLNSEDGEKVALLLDMDLNKKLFKVYAPMENVGQSTSQCLQEWPIESIFASRANFQFYSKTR